MPRTDAVFARWSRLKSGDGKRVGSPGNSVKGAFEAAPAPDARGPESPGTGAAHASCETLDFSSDFSSYVREGVSDAVHTAALRRLWLTSPLFGASDGLDTYCADYSSGLPQDAPESAVPIQAFDADKGKATAGVPVPASSPLNADLSHAALTPDPGIVPATEFPSARPAKVRT